MKWSDELHPQLDVILCRLEARVAGERLQRAIQTDVEKLMARTREASNGLSEPTHAQAL